MPLGSVKKWIDRMAGAYTEILGARPDAFGAPGWCIDKRVLALAPSYGFSYLSCTRAAAPFIFEENGMVEVPSNLPCIEEVGTEGVLDAMEKNARSTVPQVLPVHTEVEGNWHDRDFETILDKAASLGYVFSRLDDIAAGLDRGTLPVRGLKMGWVHNRAFKCAV
jgi:undecaprenyl phosphate-alpha-L-ara4FN deformylase